MYMSFAVTYVAMAFSSAWNFLRAIFDSLGAVPYYLAALAVFLAIHTILLPLRGGRMFSFGSDIAGAIRRSEHSSSKDGK